MKRSTMLSLVLAAVLGAFAAAADMKTDGALSNDERARLVELLDSSRADLEMLAAKARGDDWLRKPSADAWSVGEVVEHVAMAEEGMLAMASAALASDPDPEWQGPAAAGIDGVIGMMKDRSQKFQAPPDFEPKGEASRDEMLGRYAAARVKSLDFARSLDGAVKKHTAEGPPGKLNVEQWVAMIAAHNMRHNEQIREILAALE